MRSLLYIAGPAFEVTCLRVSRGKHKTDTAPCRAIIHRLKLAIAAGLWRARHRQLNSLKLCSVSTSRIHCCVTFSAVYCYILAALVYFRNFWLHVKVHIRSVLYHCASMATSGKGLTCRWLPSPMLHSDSVTLNAWLGMKLP